MNIYPETIDLKPLDLSSKYTTLNQIQQEYNQQFTDPYKEDKDLLLRIIHEVQSETNPISHIQINKEIEIEQYKYLKTHEELSQYARSEEEEFISTPLNENSSIKSNSTYKDLGPSENSEFDIYSKTSHSPLLSDVASSHKGEEKQIETLNKTNSSEESDEDDFL